MAQVAPVFGIQVMDLDDDDKLDLVLSGNAYDTEVNIGRYDALNGLVLMSKQEDFKYEPLPTGKSGFYVPGDAKALAKITIGDHLHLLASQNKGRLLVFEIDQQISTKGNEMRRSEKYLGSSFLSQSDQ